MQLQFVSGVGDGVGGGVGDGPGGSVAGGSPLEPHDPELGFPLHVQRKSLLHDALLSMFAQLNGVGEAVGGAVVGEFVGTVADVVCALGTKECNDIK